MIHNIKILVACLLFVGACEEQDVVVKTAAQQQQEETVARAKANCVSDGFNLRYFRDPRAPSNCYAEFWRGTTNGGPGLTWVPCSDDVTPLLCDHVPNN